MNDSSLGMILATTIAAPVVLIGCGGGAALIGSAVARFVGRLPGSGLLTSALLAEVVGITVLAVRRWRVRNPEGAGLCSDPGLDPFVGLTVGALGPVQVCNRT